MPQRASKSRSVRANDWASRLALPLGDWIKVQPFHALDYRLSFFLDFGLQRIAAEKTRYSPQNVGRRSRELAQEEFWKFSIETIVRIIERNRNV